MTQRGAWTLTVVALVGLLSLGSVVATAALRGHLGATARLSINTCGPSHPRGTVVHVTLSDRGGTMMGGANAMMVSVDASPNTVSSGTVTFVATNTGALNHELLVLPAPRDGVGTRPVGVDGKINESASLGEASRTCARGVGNGITPGTSSWVTLHLERGTYEVLCDEPWHYANGMFQTLTVR